MLENVVLQLICEKRNFVWMISLITDTNEGNIVLFLVVY